MRERATDLISRCFPLSITQTISGMVTPVSAMLVEMTIFRTPGGGLLKTAACPSEETLRKEREETCQNGFHEFKGRETKLTSSEEGRLQSFQRFRRLRGLAEGR